MFNATRRVSFAIAIALTVGWGIFFLLFLAASNTLFEAQQRSTEQATVLPSGVSLAVQVDKKIYRSGETVLIAVRNDSREPIWINQPTADCPSEFWRLEQLDSDGEHWDVITQAQTPCANTALVTRFMNHTLMSGDWPALVPSATDKDILSPAPAGTYRVTVPYLKGKNIQSGVPWPTKDVFSISSASFSII